MKPETTWTDLAEAWALIPAKRRGEIELWHELLMDAVNKARHDPGSFWNWFLTLDVRGRGNGSLAANVLWKWTGPVPRRAYEAFVEAAINEPCPSFNRVFVDPILRTYGREAVVASLLTRLEKASEDEKRGVESALYWARGSTPKTPTDYERHAEMIEKAASRLGREPSPEVKKQADRRREAAAELLMNAWPNGSARVDLDPKDYYDVRFVEADAEAAVGDEGIVVDHLLSNEGKKGCVVEVGPFGEHGEPRAVVVVDSSKLEAISRTEAQK